MNSLTDQYYSRLLSIVRQNKNIKFINDIKNNKIYVELFNGMQDVLDWEDVFDYTEE